MNLLLGSLVMNDWGALKPLVSLAFLVDARSRHRLFYLLFFVKQMMKKHWPFTIFFFSCLSYGTDMPTWVCGDCFARVFGCWVCWWFPMAVCYICGHIRHWRQRHYLKYTMTIFRTGRQWDYIFVFIYRLRIVFPCPFNRKIFCCFGLLLFERAEAPTQHMTTNTEAAWMQTEGVGKLMAHSNESSLLTIWIRIRPNFGHSIIISAIKQMHKINQKSQTQRISIVVICCEHKAYTKTGCYFSCRIFQSVCGKFGRSSRATYIEEKKLIGGKSAGETIGNAGARISHKQQQQQRKYSMNWK